MESNLLQEFLHEDCDSSIKAKLIAALDELSTGGDGARAFSFNRFNVRLDAKTREVLVEDMLNPDKAGECSSLGKSPKTSGLEGLLPKAC
jgi:hypothetical protein